LERKNKEKNMNWLIWLGIGIGLGYYLAQPKEKRLAYKEKAVKWLPNPPKRRK
jgi:hypothetical protein